jgi:hypothetical protein
MGTARSRRKKTLLLLSFILLILLLFIFNSIWSDRAKRSGEASSITNSITIVQTGKPDIKMERIGSGWRMLQPEELPVLAERITPLLKIKDVPDSAYAADEVDLTAAQLANPLASITIGQHTILLGAKDVSGERRYAMQENRVYFVPEWTLSLIQGGAQAFAKPVEQQ